MSKVSTEILERFEQGVRRDGRYCTDAFEFLHRGLQIATRSKYGPKAGPRRHVTGQELCQALRVLAQHRWGRLAREVLRRWNIHSTRDFGEMVFLMIDLHMMGKQESDRISDFDNVYDFRQAFDSYKLRAEITI